MGDHRSYDNSIEAWVARAYWASASGPARPPDARLIMLPTRVEESVLTYVCEE
jgi:hypothetical protein